MIPSYIEMTGQWSLLGLAAYNIIQGEKKMKLISRFCGKSPHFLHNFLGLFNTSCSFLLT